MKELIKFFKAIKNIEAQVVTQDKDGSVIHAESFKSVLYKTAGGFLFMGLATATITYIVLKNTYGF